MKQSNATGRAGSFFSRLWQDKRYRAILISGAAILLCAAVYLTLRFTVLRPEEDVPLPTVGNHGEAMASGRPFVIDPVSADLLQAIRVENEFGGFYYYRGEDGEFYFEGAESMYYDQTSDWMNNTSANMEDILQSVSMVDSLVNLVRYMLSVQEVEGYDPGNLASYGLEERGKAAVTLTYLDEAGEERSETVFFGNKTVSGSGYYVMKEGRDALYILADTYISKCIFTDVKAYLLPQVAPSVSSTEYPNVEQLTITKKGETFAALRKLSDQESEETGNLFTHVFTDPEGYFPSTDNLQHLLETFVSFTGKAVVDYDITKRLEDPAQRGAMQDLFRLYSLTDQEGRWVYQLYYRYSNFDITLYISEKLEIDSGEEEKQYIYYVYSPDFDLIVEFDASDLDWVGWDTLNLLDNHSFSVFIDQVSSMEFSYDTTRVRFALQGESDQLQVTSSSGVKVDADNFRQLYKAVLFTTMDGYADKPESAGKILDMKIVLRNGKSYHYEFFGLTARKAFYTLNGSGEFYINRDYVKQIMQACTGILNGEKVTVDRKN